MVVPPHLRGKRARGRIENVRRDAQRAGDLQTWQRASAVLAGLDGEQGSVVAVRLGVVPSAVTRWFQAYLAKGFDALHPGKAPGQKCRLSDDQMEQLGKFVEGGPESAGFACGIWTARMIATLIQERFGVAYNWKYVPELLHKLGFSVQRPRKRLSRANREAQEFWLRHTFPRLKKTPRSKARSSCSKTKPASNSTPPCTEPGLV
jgi:transposase